LTTWFKCDKLFESESFYYTLSYIVIAVGWGSWWSMLYQCLQSSETGASNNCGTYTQS